MKTCPMKFLLYFLMTIVVWNCRTSQEDELSQTKNRLNQALADIDSLTNMQDLKGHLVHIVFLKLKTKNDVDDVLHKLEKLNDISVVHNFLSGPFENLNDQRALLQYDLVMQMTFANIEDYNQYQYHPMHLKLREDIKPLLSAPPSTYDYIIN